MLIRRGEIFFVDFGKGKGSEQTGIRPALIIQNNIGNKYSPTTLVAPITSIMKKSIPTHVLIERNKENCLQVDSIALLEQIRLIDKSRLQEKIGIVDNDTMKLIDNAIKISFAL